MAFERLVRDDRFASRVVTTAVGELGLDRPTGVAVVDAGVSVSKSASLLKAAHELALSEGIATLIHQLAIPFLGHEGEGATDTRPDFAVVVPKVSGGNEDTDGTWLIVGDAKDYQRIRATIGDDRLLKGFLQVALGAESADAWSETPSGMDVHDHGVLAVPRNGTLSPTAVVEDISDHRSEVRMRVAEREQEAKAFASGTKRDPSDQLKHLRASYSPDTCPGCDLFNYCRDELQRSTDPTDLLIELGVKPEERQHALGLVDGVSSVGPVSHSNRQRIEATMTGAGVRSGRHRTDPIGRPGTVNVVIAKSDGATTGLYGMAIQRVSADGALDWEFHVFDDPDGRPTGRLAMRALARHLDAALAEQRVSDEDEPDPIHLVVPDSATADILVTIADSIAGDELTRLRFEQDKKMGRPALTFDGRPANVPPRLSEGDRVAVSLLIEQDRSRTLKTRSTIVDARAVLSSLVTGGGAGVSSLRLDYLVRWADSGTSGIDHRELAAEIERSISSPGAQLTPMQSNAINQAFTGSQVGGPRPADPAKFEALVKEELQYKTALIDQVVSLLSDDYPTSSLQSAIRSAEGDAQAIWRRRLSFHASDLTRFGRTYPRWRNDLVGILEADDKFTKQVEVLISPLVAHDAGRDAGNREVALARVVNIAPLALAIDSRRIADESRIVLLHVNGMPCVESANVKVAIQKGSFKIGGLSIGPLEADPGNPHALLWHPHSVPDLAIGDELVIADFHWFSENKGNANLNVGRPGVDMRSAPSTECTPSSYSDDPSGHEWCCKPHEVAEAEWSDVIAAQRARGERNPEVWPPIVDRDAFDINASDEELPVPSSEPAVDVPEDLTMDDLE